MLLLHVVLSTSQYPRSKGCMSRDILGRYREESCFESFPSFSEMKSLGAISFTPTGGDAGQISRLLQVTSGRLGVVSLRLRLSGLLWLRSDGLS